MSEQDTPTDAELIAFLEREAETARGQAAFRGQLAIVAPTPEIRSQRQADERAWVHRYHLLKAIIARLSARSPEAHDRTEPLARVDATGDSTDSRTAAGNEAK